MPTFHIFLKNIISDGKESADEIREKLLYREN